MLSNLHSFPSLTEAGFSIFFQNVIAREEYINLILAKKKLKLLKIFLCLRSITKNDEAAKKLKDD